MSGHQFSTVRLQEDVVAEVADLEAIHLDARHFILQVALRAGLAAIKADPSQYESHARAVKAATAALDGRRKRRASSPNTTGSQGC